MTLLMNVSGPQVEGKAFKGEYLLYPLRQEVGSKTEWQEVKKFMS
jgi:hypothetical protein